MPKSLPNDVLPKKQSEENKKKFLELSKIKERLYHATPRNFKEFKPGGFNSELSGHAIWLSNNPQYQPAMHNIGGDKEEYKQGTNVMPVHVQAKHPLVLDNPGILDRSQKIFADGDKSFPLLMDKKWAKKVQAMGYDSVVHADPHGRGDPHEVVMFKGNQIKSAIGNRGTYDTKEKDITKSKGGNVRPSTDQMKRELEAYHGSPHLMQPTANNPLGEFDPTKIGSGEGAQAFGYGHYLAEKPNTAQGYANTLGKFIDRIKTPEGDMSLEDALTKHHPDGRSMAKVVSNRRKTLDIDSFNKLVEDNLIPEMRVSMKLSKEKWGEVSGKRGHLYHIRIPHEHVEKMLDWDKPLSEQHPDVQALFKQDKLGQTVLPNGEKVASNKLRGESLYSAIGEGLGGSRNAASDWLKNAGIPGIKYLDAGSRKDGEGTRNFVVFPGNEHMMKIVHREAKGGLVHEGNSVHVIQHKARGGSQKEDKAKFLEKSKVKDVLYRGGHGYQEMPEGFMKGEARPNYATFASTSPYVASSYAAQGGHKGMEGEVGAVVPMHIKAKMLHEFPVTVDKRGHRDFDMFAFDRHARTLAPGHALVARQVYDIGPRASNETDPKKLWSYPSDIYAWNKGTEVKSAFDKASGGSIKSIPDEPGSTPIKEGHVRLYHQTDGDNLRKIEKEGLLFKHAKGIEGPKAIYAGETPFYGKAEEKPTLEFQVPKEHWQSPFVLSDVMPKDIIAAHYPWHRHARYLEDKDNKQALENTLSGKHDKLDGDTGKAVKYIKAKYGVNKAGGGSVKEATHYVSASSIEPPHGIRDKKKLSLLINSMKKLGWKGRPILTYDVGRGDEALTGSHRIHAAKNTNIKIPIHRIENAGDHIDEDDKSIHDLGFMELGNQIKWLNKFGHKDAANLLKQEPEFSKGGSVKEPKSTVPAYKLFRVDKNHPGKLFPLFVDSKTPVEKDKWVEAKAGEKTGDKVKSKIGPLANRPGWHAGDLPVATHIGEKSDPSMNKPDRRPSNQVWAEVDMPNDVDWQSEANKRGTNAKGKLVAVKAHITDQVPKGGHYRYKTNPNMTGNWLIGGAMKVKKVLPDEEVQRINNKAGASDLPREKPINLKDYGFNGGGDVHPTKEQAAANKKKYLAESTEKRRLYHGSRHYGKNGVNEKLRSEGGIREFSTGNRGMTFLTPSKGFANEYAGGNKLRDESSGAVYPVHVQVKNPFDYENPEHVERLAKHLPKADSIWSIHHKKTPAQIREKLATGDWSWIEDPQVIQTAKKLGHDAMYMQEIHEGFGKNVKNLGVFDPRYIKSAIGNRGTYDTEDYDITKAKGGRVGKAQMQWELMRKKKG